MCDIISLIYNESVSQITITYIYSISLNSEDGKLSRTEILDNYPEFLQSTATDWGKAMLHHDEL